MRLALILILTTILAAPSMARQADLSAGLDLAMQPDFVRRDLVNIHDGLRLDASQTPILETLFGDYEAAFMAGVEEIRTQMAHLRPVVGGFDEEVQQQREQIRTRAAALVEETRQLREEMLEKGELDEASMRELRARFEEKAAQLREELKRMQTQPLTAENIQNALRDSLDLLEAWQARKSTLHDEFVGGLRAILTEEQQSLWPALERRLTREKTLVQGRLSGESIDLHHIVRDLGLEPTSGAAAGSEAAGVSESTAQAIESALQEYEVRLHRALQQRNQYLAASQRQLLESIETGDAQTLNRQIQFCMAVRAVNDEYAQIIASLLPPEAASGFTRAYQSRGYPRVFRTTLTQRLLNAARERPGIDTETLAAVNALQEAYENELASVNERLLQVVRAHEPVEMRTRWLQRGLESGQLLQAAADPVRAETAKRQALNQRYNRQLKELLGADVIKQLPGGDAVLQEDHDAEH